MSDNFEGLDESELEQLDRFLLDRIPEHDHSAEEDEGILDLTELDGMFTAIVSGPVMIMPSQWLPAVWGDFEPVWKSEKELEIILSLMMRHMNGIATTLMERPEAFEPMYSERRVKGKSHLIVDEWCEGYWRGISLAADEWNLDDRLMRILLAPILAFTSESGWGGHEFQENEVVNIQNAIAPNVREIHAYWLARRSKNTPATRPKPKQSPRVGRNDPCPCGSGKKYKKCCLH